MRGYIKPLSPSCARDDHDEDDHDEDDTRDHSILPRKPLDIQREGTSFLREISVCVKQLKEHFVT